MKVEEFLALTIEEQVNYVNEFLNKGKTLEDIAKTMEKKNGKNPSGSWISGHLRSFGYTHQNKKYVFTGLPKLSEPSEMPISELEELLAYKDILIELAKRQTGAINLKEGELDISAINQYESEEFSTKTLKLPVSLSQRMDELSKRTRYKMQDLLILAVHQFIEQHDN